VKSILLKGAAFCGLLAFFWWLGGFEPPDTDGMGRGGGRVTKAWLMTVLLFVVGAVLLLWGEDVADAIASEMPAAGFRVIGGLLVFAGALWMAMLKENLR
jgi:hypothetical protein